MTKNTSEDVHQQSELLVMDYLRGTKAMKTMDALSKWISDKSKKKVIRSTSSASNVSSPTVSDLFAKDATANKSSKDRANSVLEFMIGVRKSTKSPKVSCSPVNGSGSFEVKGAKVNESMPATSLKKSEWTEDDLSRLKKEAKKTHHITDKTERWKVVGAVLGRSKRECYEKYKEIRKQPKGKRQTVDEIAEDKVLLDLSSEYEPQKVIKSTSKSNSPKNIKGMYSVEKEEAIQPPKKGKNKVNVKIPNESTSEGWCKGRVSAIVPDDVRSSIPPKKQDQCPAVIEDMEDFDDIIERKQRTKQIYLTTGPSKGKQLPSSDVVALRKLFFNDTKKKLSPHWVHQGFSFSDVDGLQYGIIQHEGGPCGVMAVVQAYLLYYLLKDNRDPPAQATPAQLQRVLVLALTQIIWQAANGLTCYIALKGEIATLDHILVSQLHSRHELEQFLSVHVAHFTDPKGYGVVLLVVSVMLSRGLVAIESDMDTATGTIPTLIGAHDYCTQEMVNLLLLGYACSNVFDGIKDLGDESQSMVLRGVSKQGLVGFLTLFEAYDYMVVGEHLKDPLTNIWVVCSESHYSVLYADPSLPSLPTDKNFDLFYFDGLANQDEVIQLTVNPIGLATKPETAHQKDLIPPINLVIQTKWPRATIDWNTTEPLL